VSSLFVRDDTSKTSHHRRLLQTSHQEVIALTTERLIMTSRTNPHHGVSAPRDVLQPALMPQTISYHTTSRQRLVENTELGLAAAGVLPSALGVRDGMRITLAGCISLSDHARQRLPTDLGGRAGGLFGSDDTDGSPYRHGPGGSSPPSRAPPPPPPPPPAPPPPAPPFQSPAPGRQARLPPPPEACQCNTNRPSSCPSANSWLGSAGRDMGGATALWACASGPTLGNERRTCRTTLARASLCIRLQDLKRVGTHAFPGCSH
jgi:hypothetical protein